MPRRMSRALAVRPVNSLKHIIDVQSAAIGTGAIVTDLVDVVDSPDTDVGPNQCHVGSNVKAVYLRVDAVTTVSPSSGATRPSLYMYVLKNPANEINTGNMPPDAVGVNKRRKFVIHQEMMMLSKDSSDTFPRTLFKGVILIPQRYQRMGIEDKLSVVIAWNSSADAAITADLCLQCIYKEFY